MLTFFMLLLVVPRISSTFYVQNITDLSKCTVHYSRSDNNYKDFYEISDDSHKNGSILDFHFSVLAPSDAHILLSPIVKPNVTLPVYEIVLGAGGDSFTDIRRAQKASVQSSFRHPKGILSALDPQSFWIHISKDGVIEVGREGDELPFVNWRDPHPLAVKYFSFGTWTGVEAKWFFDCPRKDNTTNIKEVKIFTNLERLREDLLASYDPYVRPVLNHSTVTTVFLALNAHSITLDERKSSLKVEGRLRLSWNDEKLTWDPTKYGNISSLHLLGRQVWQPNLILHNAMSLLQDNFVDDAMMTVTSNGSVSWNPTAHLNVWCDAINLGHWPSDNHTCEVIFGVSTDFKFLKLHFLRGDENKILMRQFNSEWKVLDIETNSDFETKEADRPRFLKLIFKLTRRSEIYDVIFFVPFLVIATSMLLTFCVSPFDFSKICLCCLQLLITTIVSVILFDILPSHPEKLPYLVVLYSSSYVAAIFCIILSTIVINLSRSSHNRPVPHCLWQTLMLKPVQKLFLLPSVKMAKQYGKLNDASATKVSESVQNTWIVLGIFIDRLAFAAYFIFIITAITHKY